MKSRSIRTMPIFVFGLMSACTRQSEPAQASPAAPSVQQPSSPARATAPISNPPHALVASLAGAGLRPNGLRPVLVRGWGTIWGFDVSRGDARVTWDQFRAVRDQSGLHPVLVCSEHGNLFDGSITEHESPDDVIRRAAEVDAAAWLKQRADEGLQDGEESLTPDFNDDDPGVIEADELAMPERGRKGTVQIALLPTKRPWEAFAFIQYGDWNAYPDAAKHVAVMKHWFDRFGAELAVVADDVIEMVVNRPPSDVGSCRQLAIEQFGYTNDLVHQGYGKFGTLARILSGRRHWFFWWD